MLLPVTEISPLLARIADALARTADALDRLAAPLPAEADPSQHRSLRWDGSRLLAVSPASPLPLELFVGVETQMAALAQAFGAHVRELPSHDCLLWGARGSGKSALVRAVSHKAGLHMVEAGAGALESLPALFGRLAESDRAFLVFVDDLAFEPSDPAIRTLRSLLDGGVTARPANVRIAVTSNHRHLVAREATSAADLTGTLRHARDGLDDQLALVDRFGLVLGFHTPSQDEYLEMVHRHCAAEGLAVDATDALAFALARGGRSGRTAWHYRMELLARASSN